MADAHCAPPAGIARRGFMIAGAGAAALATGLVVPALRVRRRNRRLPLHPPRRSR